VLSVARILGLVVAPVTALVLGIILLASSQPRPHMLAGALVSTAVFCLLAAPLSLKAARHSDPRDRGLLGEMGGWLVLFSLAMLSFAALVLFKYSRR